MKTKQLTLTDIKKTLYKTKPMATCFADNGKECLYDVIINDEYQVFFTVPISEMGLSKFNKKEPAQLLIRWIDSDFNYIGN